MDYAVPGSRKAQEDERLKAQQPMLQDANDGLGQTAAAGGLRKLADESEALFEAQTGEDASEITRRPVARMKATAMTLMGYKAPGTAYDKQEHYEALTDGIPYEFHDDIMEVDTLEGAHRARARVLQDIERGKRMGLQDSGHLAMMAGSMIDVDLPMVMLSGGAYGSAKVARAALRASKVAGLSPRAAMRLSGSAQGINAGAQAGVVVGAADAAWRETTGWEDVANMALTTMLLGGAIGTATKGDVRTSVKAAQQEFYERIGRDDPSLSENFNANDLQGDNIVDFMERVEEGSIGAAQAQPTPKVATGATQGATPTNQGWIDAARKWRHDSGWQDTKDAVADEWWAKAALSGAANLTTNNFARLYKSKSAVANFIAGNIFESASGIGRGRATAATRMENYHRRIQTMLGPRIITHAQEWAKKNDQTWQSSGYHISENGMATFNREVMLELNDRAQGRNSTRSPEVKRAADQYEMAGQEALSVARGRDNETPIDGFENVPDRRGYTPYKWSGNKITDLVKRGVATQSDMEQALAQSYRNAGLGQGKDAETIAKAVIHRAITKDLDIDTSVLSLLTGDGKDFMRESMILMGMKEMEADAIIDRLVGKQHNASKDAFAKTRNEVDMATRIKTQDGSELRIVDLMDNDMHGVWQRYSRQVSGSAALARHGITNRAQRQEIIAAMHAEQRALGEDVIDGDLIDAMFSHFNAGPVKGYAAGMTNEGIGHAALAKRMANLALLEKLGVTQLAETGVIMAQNGLANWLRRGPMALFDKQLRAADKVVLDDLAFFTGEIGKDHWHFAPWLDLDDTTRGEKGDWLRSVNKWTQVGSFVQGYTSAFNQVRSFQQQTVALGMADKVFREIKKAVDAGKDLDEGVALRFEGDLGLMKDDIQKLEQLVNSGVIEFRTEGGRTFVNRLNMDQWDTEIGEVFASSVVRNMNQLVQKSMAGEQDAWMHTHVGSIFMHLKTFPLQAIQKQFIRNVRYGDKQALATVLMGMATAAVAVKVRDAIDGRERSASETAKAAFSYSNMTGWIPTVYDPMMTLIGMDDARVNPYGPYFDWTPPTVKIANDMLRLPGAAIDTVTGNADWYDKQALKALPFAGTYGLSRAFD